MKSSNIRLIIVLTIIVSLGVIITQVYWINRWIGLRQREYEFKANRALRSVARDIMSLKETEVPKSSPVERINPNYFIAQINVYVEKDVLEHYLVKALSKEEIYSDFQFGFYDCMSDTVQYRGEYYQNAFETNRAQFAFPRLKRNNYYFGVYFSNRKIYISTEIKLWMITSFILMCLLALLGRLLFVIFKQKRLSEIQKDFVNNMAHEFKTPLSGIQLAAAIFKNPDNYDNQARLLNYATIINNESAQLNRQVDRILQMSKVEKNNFQLNLETVNCQELIRIAVHNLQSDLTQAEAKLTLHVPDDPVIIKADSHWLIHAIENLIDNAIKYNTEVPEIHIFLKKERKKVYISIQDNGIGISKAGQKYLFQKFYRVPTGNLHDVKGLGLGLYYVRLIAKAHRGNATYVNQEKGSIFTINIPQNQ